MALAFERGQWSPQLELRSIADLWKAQVNHMFSLHGVDTGDLNPTIGFQPIWGYPPDQWDRRKTELSSLMTKVLGLNPCPSSEGMGDDSPRHETDKNNSEKRSGKN